MWIEFNEKLWISLKLDDYMSYWRNKAGGVKGYPDTVTSANYIILCVRVPSPPPLQSPMRNEGIKMWPIYTVAGWAIF